MSQANLLSDMATAIVMEDLDPQRIPAFWDALQNLHDDLEWTHASMDQFETCCDILQQTQMDEDDHPQLPAAVAGVLQLTWKGAEGKLRHEIPADG